jgi:hypothetical protein
MRTLLAASILAASSAVLLSACASANPDAPDGPDGEQTAETSEALVARGAGSAASAGGDHVIVDPAPDPGVKPPKQLGVHFGGGVLAPPTCIGTQVRFDIRRKTRSCEDLPGAYVDGTGAVLVPGTGGHFRVGRLLASTSVPETFKEKACMYTWEPDACAGPDKPKLLVEPGENLDERPASCISNPESCAIKPATPEPFRIPHVIPNGPGRCEVCGFATNRSFFAILPTNMSFSFRLANETTSRFVYVTQPPGVVDAAPVTLVEVALPYDVADQDVDLFPAYQ